MHRRLLGALIVALIALLPSWLPFRPRQPQSTPPRRPRWSPQSTRFRGSVSNINTTYDMMHPDAQAAVERNVALNLFNDVYSRRWRVRRKSWRWTSARGPGR